MSSENYLDQNDKDCSWNCWNMHSCHIRPAWTFLGCFFLLFHYWCSIVWNSTNSYINLSHTAVPACSNISAAGRLYEYQRQSVKLLISINQNIHQVDQTSHTIYLYICWAKKETLVACVSRFCLESPTRNFCAQRIISEPTFFFRSESAPKTKKYVLPGRELRNKQ